jgi:energy-coupling factor transporter ATP-binding protein EcfA2
MGTDPLILDQPEDDLENKLIKHLAVETLKRIKTRRQVIVSTHNANIVVTSTAENILALEHGELLPRSKPKAHSRSRKSRPTSARFSKVARTRSRPGTAD